MMYQKGIKYLEKYKLALYIFLKKSVNKEQKKLNL